MYETISKRKKLYEEIVDQIIALIQQKQLQAGDKLPSERELSEELGVSRTVLREAMKALEERELVEIRHGSGTFIRSPSIDTIARSVSFVVWTDPDRYIELMNVREFLDVEIAGRLARSAPQAELAAMATAIDNMWQLLDSPKEFSEQDVAFHMAFYRATKNELLLTIMLPITRLLMEAMELTFHSPGSAEMSLRRHEQLLDRIKAGDALGARRTMQEIISRGKERLKESLAQQS